MQGKESAQACSSLPLSNMYYSYEIVLKHFRHEILRHKGTAITDDGRFLHLVMCFWFHLLLVTALSAELSVSSPFIS